MPVPEPPAAELLGDVAVVPLLLFASDLVFPLPAEPSALLLLADEFAPVPSPDGWDEVFGEFALSPPEAPVVDDEPVFAPADFIA